MGTSSDTRQPVVWAFLAGALAVILPAFAALVVPMESTLDRGQYGGVP
jgi:hypothetical protein